MRGARMPEGMLVTIDPMPSSALISAAIAVLAPRSIELSAMTGSIAPSASPNRVAGPNAATATERRRNSAPSRAAGLGAGGLGRLTGVRADYQSSAPIVLPAARLPSSGFPAAGPGRRGLPGRARSRFLPLLFQVRSAH